MCWIFVSDFQSEISRSDKINWNSWYKTILLHFGYRLELKYFLFSHFIEQFIDLRKVRMEKLEFRTEIREQVVNE